MKITKYIHSCLLVETPDRVAIFDPGAMSYPAFDISKLEKLDDIFITHIHQDHMHIPFVKELREKFPGARITTTKEAAQKLKAEGIDAQTSPPEGVVFFESPHEDTRPIFPIPEEIGIHYLDLLTDPGDSHSFHETKAVLALPITAPWGSSIKGFNLAMELKPKFVIPIHDWHWSDEARHSMYDTYELIAQKQGVTFLKPETGQPLEVSV